MEFEKYQIHQATLYWASQRLYSEIRCTTGSPPSRAATKTYNVQRALWDGPGEHTLDQEKAQEDFVQWFWTTMAKVNTLAPGTTPRAAVWTKGQEMARKLGQLLSWPIQNLEVDSPNCPSVRRLNLSQREKAEFYGVHLRAALMTSVVEDWNKELGE